MSAIVSESESGDSEEVQNDGELSSSEEENDRPLQPILSGNIIVRYNLRALSKDELTDEDRPITVPGTRARGVGVARVEGTEDVNWIFLKCDDIPVENCPRHKYTPLTLLRVRNGTELNLKGTLFYRCDYKLGGYLASGYEKICGHNIYFSYPRAQLEDEMKRLNVEDRPLEDNKNLHN